MADQDIGLELWKSTDDYIVDHLLDNDEALEAALARNQQEGLPAIDVSRPQADFLAILARGINAKRVLEVGTLGGYSTIQLARAVGEDGIVTTLELIPKHAEVAAANIAAAGLADRVSIGVGPATELLEALVEDPPEPFDLVFIDADKENSPEYFKLARKLVRPGATIVVDNIVRHGDLIEQSSTDAGTLGNRRLFELLRGDPTVQATTVQTVGHKGWDGFTIAVVK